VSLLKIIPKQEAKDRVLISERDVHFGDIETLEFKYTFRKSSNGALDSFKFPTHEFEKN